MSAAEHQIETDTETRESGFLVRTFEAEITPGEGRTADVRIVPYGETATVADGFGGVARGIPYQEEWMPGAFDGQLRAANRVLANFEHHPGLAGVVGHGLDLREAADGFHGSFKFHETPDGDKALMLVREGILGGVSLEARPLKSIRSAAGVVRRVKAHLKAVAFCREPAFSSAVVLAVREAPMLDEELLPADLDPELVERLRAQGIALPDRYKAQPAETDTPDQDGTSEAAPVATETTTATEER